MASLLQSLAVSFSVTLAGPESPFSLLQYPRQLVLRRSRASSMMAQLGENIVSDSICLFLCVF